MSCGIRASQESYQLRNSTASINLGRELRDQDVSEEDFSRLLKARSDYENARVEASISGSVGQASLIEHKATMLAGYREIMGDEKFSIYLRNHSLEYQLAEGLISDTGAPSSISLRAWAIQDELARAVAKVQSANDPLLAMKVEQLRLRANQELAAIVGAEKARVYLETVQPKP